MVILYASLFFVHNTDRCLNAEWQTAEWTSNLVKACPFVLARVAIFHNIRVIDYLTWHANIIFFLIIFFIMMYWWLLYQIFLTFGIVIELVELAEGTALWANFRIFIFFPLSYL